MSIFGSGKDGDVDFSGSHILIGGHREFRNVTANNLSARWCDTDGYTIRISGVLYMRNLWFRSHCRNTSPGVLIGGGAGGAGGQGGSVDKNGFAGSINNNVRGGGGGGGGGHQTNPVTSGGAGGAGGMGGSSGGDLIIFARIIIFDGDNCVFDVRGTNGSNGSLGGNGQIFSYSDGKTTYTGCTGGGGGGAGGQGGHGGNIILRCTTFSGTPTMLVSGGQGGTGRAGGSITTNRLSGGGLAGGTGHSTYYKGGNGGKCSGPSSDASPGQAGANGAAGNNGTIDWRIVTDHDMFLNHMI